MGEVITFNESEMTIAGGIGVEGKRGLGGSWGLRQRNVLCIYW